MIPRYSRPEMAKIWEPQNRVRIWFEIETHARDAMAALGVIPQSAAKAARKKGRFDAARIDESERETKHDLIAFPINLTSSDALDTHRSVPRSAAFAGGGGRLARRTPGAARPVSIP